MEIFSKLGVDWRLLIAQIVNFLVLLWVLRRFAYVPMLRFLDTRGKRIEKGLEDAKMATDKLLEIEIREREILEAAQKEASVILMEARDNAKRLGEKITLESQSEASRILEEARKKIAVEQELLRTDMKRELIGLVTLATEKVLGEKLKDAQDERIIHSIVKTL